MIRQPPRSFTRNTTDYRKNSITPTNRLLPAQRGRNTTRSARGRHQGYLRYQSKTPASILNRKVFYTKTVCITRLFARGSTSSFFYQQSEWSATEVDLVAKWGSLANRMPRKKHRLLTGYY